MKKDKYQKDKISFFEFIVLKENKNQLFQFLVFYFIVYILLIYLYPYPASISDSGAYVNAAAAGTMDTYRPFGYSGFLILIHKLSASIRFVVASQYILNVLATLILIYTIKYFFPRESNTLFYVYAFIAAFSPLVFYLANSILSDSLFTSLTILWITSGIWMFYTVKNWNKSIFYLLHLFLLFYLIKVRYTGLVYLPVSLLLIYISFYKRNISMRLILIIVPLLILFVYYKDQKDRINKLVHVNTFSGFSGWQMANNALHTIPYINLNPADIKDEKTRDFAGFLIERDSLLVLEVKPSAKFMWNNKLPLKEYLFTEMQRTKTSYIYQWNYLGENVYSKFGSYILKKYPFQFAIRYLLPNSRLILYPVQDQVVRRFANDGIPADLLKYWFEFDAREKIYSRSILFEKGFIMIPVGRLIIWILLITSLLISFIKREKILWVPYQKLIFWLLLTFIAVYFAFSAYAGPFELRYSAPLHLLQVSLIYILINSLMAGSGVRRENK